MRKVLLCSLVCISLSCLCSAYGNIDKSSTDNADSNKCNAAKNYEGTTVGVGFNVGIQKAVAEANREFRGTSSSVRSTNFGGTITLGWQKNICGNCFIGVEGGIDFGGSKSVAVGGVLKDDSQIALQESYKRNLVSKALLELAHQFVQFDSPVSPVQVIDQVAWRNLVGTLKYLGGALGSADANGLPSDVNVRTFITSSSNGRGFWDIRNYNGRVQDISYPGAQLVDFIPNTVRYMQNANGVGSGVIDTIKEMRDYVIRRCPDLAIVLQNIAQGNIDSPMLRIRHNDRPPIPIYDAAVGGSVPDLAAYVVGRFLAGEVSTLIDDLNDIGVPNVFHGTPGEQIDSAENVMLALHYPTLDNSTLPLGMDRNNVETLKTKTSFGICPHIAVKFGYFLKEYKICMYTKVGFIQLNGEVAPANRVYNIPSENFKKITPLIAVGVSKSVRDKWGVTLEISHAFKTTKNLQDVCLFNRYYIRNRVSLSRTNLRALVTYNF